MFKLFEKVSGKPVLNHNPSKSKSPFDPDTALLLAELSDLVYQDNPIVVEKTLREQYGFERAKFYSLNSHMHLQKYSHFQKLLKTFRLKKAVIDLQFFIAHRLEGSSNKTYIVFRGTEKFDDWLTNLKTGERILSKTSIRAHGGFVDAVELFLHHVETGEKRLLDQTETTEIVLGGHSLGGALATLATAYFVEAGFSGSITAYTFGAPPVAGEDVLRKLDGLPLYRIVHEEDPVPKASDFGKKIPDLFDFILDRFGFGTSEWDEMQHLGYEFCINGPSEEDPHHCSEYIRHLRRIQAENKIF